MHEARTKKKARKETCRGAGAENLSERSAQRRTTRSKGRDGPQRLGTHGQATRERARGRRRSGRLQVGKTASARPRRLEGTRRGVARAGAADHDNGEETTAADDRACQAKEVLGTSPRLPSTLSKPTAQTDAPHRRPTKKTRVTQDSELHRKGGSRRGRSPHTYSRSKTRKSR
jgi:hypothetical protein